MASAAAPEHGEAQLLLALARRLRPVKLSNMRVRALATAASAAFCALTARWTQVRGGRAVARSSGAPDVRVVGVEAAFAVSKMKAPRCEHTDRGPVAPDSPGATDRGSRGWLRRGRIPPTLDFGRSNC